METNEISINIEVNDKLPNNMETEENKWYTRLTIYGNDKEHRHNTDLCNIIASVNELNLDVESHEIAAEMYEMKKDKDINYYQIFPLTKKVIPKLTREERNKKRLVWIEKNCK